ncbi:MAG: putative TIM-barrel fold metal-dependent hydrolase [Oleiphilaceae bacterium]|jgi:predicted TIM-barrel fold metal-dependent hydrolase
MFNNFTLFDSHFHIIDPHFPLVPNNDFLPEAFTTEDYLKRMSAYNLVGGVVVSGSFQTFDQGYLLAALKTLGEGFVGVTQVPASISDNELSELNNTGVRAVRFNLKRGGSEDVKHLKYMAQRVHDLFAWHVELYIDSVNLTELKTLITNLPSVSIDHLGLSRASLPDIRYLFERNIKLKACGFGRVDFDVKQVLSELYSINPSALMFGTDLPSTRAPKAYQDSDFLLVQETFDDEQACAAIFSENARNFYLKI